MSELTEAQLGFINDLKKERKSSIRQEQEEDRLEIAQKPYRPFYVRPGFWVAIILVVAVLLIFLVYTFTYSLESNLGMGAIVEITKQGDPRLVQAVEAQSGLGNLETITTLYESRHLIAMVILAGAVFVSGLIVLLLGILSGKEDNENNEP